MKSFDIRRPAQLFKTTNPKKTGRNTIHKIGIKLVTE